LLIDVSYLVRAEVTAIVETVAQTALLLNSRCKDIFDCHVPAFAFAIESDLASTYN
jgi:hypothetical protein